MTKKKKKKKRQKRKRETIKKNIDFCLRKKSDIFCNEHRVGLGVPGIFILYIFEILNVFKLKSYFLFL